MGFSATTAHARAKRSRPGDAPAAQGPAPTAPAPAGGFYAAGPALSLGMPVQAQLVVGRADDPFEREADSAAEHVMAKRATPAITPVPPGGPAKSVPAQPLLLQRQVADDEKEEPEQLVQACACNGPCNCDAGQSGDEEQGSQPAQAVIETGAAEQVQAKYEFPPIPDAEKAADAGGAEPVAEAAAAEQPAEEEDTGEDTDKQPKVSLPDVEPYAPMETIPPIQAQAQGAGSASHAPPAAGGRGMAGFQRSLHSTGGGSELSSPVRSEMEQHFGNDLGQVRVHTDSASINMNRNLGARAFTHKNDIFFNAGEYAPGSPGGKRLLAHELTHTIQQGAAGGTIQRFTAPAQDVAVEPKPARPNDGAEVSGRMNQKINDHPNVKDQDDLSEEERREKEKPNRGEVRKESSAISSSGESRPSVDRGAAAQAKTTEQKEQMASDLEEQAPESGEAEAEGEEKKAELSPAEAAAQQAQAAEQQAAAVAIPSEPAPFRHPTITAPVDSAGEPLPRNSQIDTQVRGLGYIGEMLRTKGYEMKRHAAETTMGAYGNDAVLGRQREDLANAEEGTATMETHNEARQEIATQSHEAHAESTQRQEFVAGSAPDLAAKAGEGQADSGELAAEARGKADQSQSEIPDDEDARADAEQQSGEMGDTAKGAESMDQAITQSGERARQYEADATAAAEQNQQSDAQIGETEDVISQTDARIQEMHAKNATSQSQIEKVASGPALIRAHAQQTAQSGDELIAATVVMEQELNALQEQYLADMAAIESREAAEKRVQEEQAKKKEQPEMSPEDQQLVELAGVSDKEQEQRVAEMTQPQRTGLLAALEKMIQRTPDQGTEATEGARKKVDTGLSKKIMGDQPADPRAENIREVENRRIARVGGVLDVADKNMVFLTAEQQRMLASQLVAQSITDDIKNISILQMGKGMIQGMIDPRQSLTGVVGGFEKMLTGFANIGNWDAWKKDPLGNLLQVAADITTGLAMIFSSILGIAALITAVMVALTIISWFTLSWFTGPVIGWMGTIMTYAGWGAIISGGLAVYFNYLAYIKNLHDAGTAETARELFGNTEQMKQNASDGFQGAMAVVEGIGAVKMGPKLSSGEFFKQVPRSPGQWASQTLQSGRDGLAAVGRAPAAIARGIKRLFQGGKQGLLRFKERIQGLFRRRQPGNVGASEPHVQTPAGRAQHQSHLDDARGKPLSQMDDAQRAAEMRELGENRPRRVEAGSEHFDTYDVEIKSNGHTYRRRKDGKGWCRFTAKECGIQEADLPNSVKEQSQKFDTDATATTEKAVGTKQAEANKWPQEPPPGYEWYNGTDGKPAVRNKKGNDGPVLDYDPASKTFPPKPDAAPKPDVRPIEGEKARIGHSDLDDVKVTKVEVDATGAKKSVEVDARQRLKELEGERTAAQGRKQTAQTAGDEAAASKAHGEMVRASEELGEVATDAAMKKLAPNAQRMEAELPGAQKSGEFDRIYKDGDTVYIAEGKGAGSQRGSRKTAEGLRAEQGTPQYRDDIIRNMDEKVARHKVSDAYKTDPAFKARVDALQRTVDDLRTARQKGTLKYVQVNQKVDPTGALKPQIEVTPFDPSKFEKVGSN